MPRNFLLGVVCLIIIFDLLATLKYIGRFRYRYLYTYIVYIICIFKKSLSWTSYSDIIKTCKYTNNIINNCNISNSTTATPMHEKKTNGKLHGAIKNDAYSLTWCFGKNTKRNITLWLIVTHTVSMFRFESMILSTKRYNSIYHLLYLA